MEKRIERDSMGEIEVASDKLWGAQTQRSYENFPQGVAIMPEEQIKSMVIVKKNDYTFRFFRIIIGSRL